MARNSTERLVAIWNRENPLFPAHRQDSQPAFHHLQLWHSADCKRVEVQLIL